MGGSTNSPKLGDRTKDNRRATTKEASLPDPDKPSRHTSGCEQTEAHTEAGFSHWGRRSPQHVSPHEPATTSPLNAPYTTARGCYCSKDIAHRKSSTNPLGPRSSQTSTRTGSCCISVTFSTNSLKFAGSTCSLRTVLVFSCFLLFSFVFSAHLSVTQTCFDF